MTTQPRFALYVITEAAAEHLMAKVSDLTAAIGNFSNIVSEAAAILQKPDAAPADDPALQTVLDGINSATKALGDAVAAYNAAHPATPAAPASPPAS